MEKVHKICGNCTEKNFCRGMCRELNNYLVNKQKQNKDTIKKEHKKSH